MPKTNEEVFNEWFKWHNQEEPSVVSNDWHVIKLEQNKSFYLSERVMDTAVAPAVPYKVILGYYSDNITLKARIWYFSGSEANWRAFTGFRPGGAWMKGYEVEGDVNRLYTSMGYIFECFTTTKFSELLSNFWNQSECDCKFNRIFPWNNGNPAPKSASYPVYQYITSEEHRPAGIAADWNKERIFSLANLPAGVTDDVDSLSKKVGSVKIQKEYHSSANPNMRAIGHRFKKDTELNKWLLSCLGNKISEIRLNHPVLNDDYIVTTFRLPGNVIGKGSGNDLHIEIAASCRDKSHAWYNFTPSRQELNTRVCWVRDVYYLSTPTTSFGTRKEIPINLAFLVQKPCDYNSQVSADYKKKVSPDDAVNMVGGKYILLSMLNETTSRLIKNFKDQQGYACFRGNHQLKDIHVQLDYQSAEAFAFLKELVLAGINEYVCIHTGPKNKSEFGSGGFHGGSGIDRANALRIEVESCKTTGDLSNKLYACFIENKIGTFTGGWLSKIRTNPTSLFTCVCRYLLAPFVVDSLESGVFQRPVSAPWDKNTIPKNKSGLDGIARMAEYIRKDSLVNIQDRLEGQYITDVAANILVALRG
ncbi:MAG: hypothetical protein RIQ52_412 [Pseudomonadota bacterium]